MRLNTLQPAPGSRKSAKRVGRGMGCGWGKTCGKGHKGQKSRSGASVPSSFEGGQMPLHMRLPKFGFSSRKPPSCTIPLERLNQFEEGIITLKLLRSKRIVRAKHGDRVKIILRGKLSRAVQIDGIPITDGARAAVEALGGSIKEDGNNSQSTYS